MIRFFKTLQPATLFFVPLVILAFWIRNIFHANPVTDNNSLPLWDVAASFFSVFPSAVNFLILSALISFQAIYLNLMINRHEVIYKNTFLPSFMFAVLISSTPSFMQFHPVHLVNLLMLFILNRAFTLFKNDSPVSALFDCGFLSGIAALIYFPAVIILPFLLITLIILRPFKIKEWLITIIGIILPYFFLSVFLFWNHNIAGFWKLYIGMFYDLSPHLTIQPYPAVTVLCIYLLVLLVYSLVKLRLNYRKNIIRTRSNEQVIFLLLITGAGWLLLSEKIDIIHFGFLMIPLSIFCSYLFISAGKRTMIFEYVLWVLLILIVWNQFP